MAFSAAALACRVPSFMAEYNGSSTQRPGCEDAAGSEERFGWPSSGDWDGFGFDVWFIRNSFFVHWIGCGGAILGAIMSRTRICNRNTARNRGVCFSLSASMIVVKLLLSSR